MAPKDMKTISACICCYTAVDCSDIAILCKSESEMLCFVQKGCLMAGEPMLGPGMITAEVR